MNRKTDVLIMGGGLAGLTLALQLRQTVPSVSVIVLDPRAKPAPETIFTVGESMVEVSSWYLREVLGLGEHLIKHHLPKFGLRFFMSDADNSDISRRPEYGLMKIPERPTQLHMEIPGVHLTTYNIDRGRLENHLVECCQDAGAEVLHGCQVKSVNLGKPHEIVVDGEVNSKLQARWVIDATGRAGFLSKQLGLRRPQEHFVNAVWFRLNGRVDPDSMTKDAAFHNRMFPDMRWLSTNHFMGDGYWVWVIPLPDNATSVGIMTDPSVHSFKQTNRYERAMAWLRQHEPSLSESVDSLDRLDFRVLKAQSYNSLKTLSTDRWALCGESAFHSDALYSPGGDFIAVGNTLVTQLIASDFSASQSRLSILVKFGEQLCAGMFRHYMGLYRGSYQLMGRPGTMLQKVAWDTSVYFAYNVLLFRNGRFCDPLFHREIRKENSRLESLQRQMIGHLKSFNNKTTYSGKYIDQAQVEPIQSLYMSTEPHLDGSDLKTQLGTNLDTLERFAKNIDELVL